MKTLSILAGGILLRVTNGRYTTAEGRKILNAKKAAWQKHAALMQEALNLEHLSGHGIRAIDGRKMTFAPFSA